jgi:tuftelin-interacting protein 11
MLKYIVPKLSGALRTSFRIDPRNQSMETFNQTLLWSSFIRPSIFAQIYEAEFFAEWLKVLHFWLIQPRVSFEEVAQWYQFWKGSFPAELREYGGIGRGFTRGLQLMNQAIELGEDAPLKLPKPDWKAEVAAAALAAKALAGEGMKARKGAGTKPAARTHEITFRSIVEEFAAARNLLFMPTNKAHAHSRMPLFRVSPSADGKKGLLVYILDDAVWASTKGGSGSEMDEFRAISLDDMVIRATAAS